MHGDVATLGFTCADSVAPRQHRSERYMKKPTGTRVQYRSIRRTVNLSLSLSVCMYEVRFTLYK